jgi:arylsulfatase A-like enzyme
MLSAPSDHMKPTTLVRAVTFIALAFAGSAFAQQILPPQEPPFRGKIGRTVKDSTPDFPKEVQAPKGAPNVLLILTDDVGFGASSTFGGPILTPTFDRLAASGLRYNNFHTTALCSPTRAALTLFRNATEDLPYLLSMSHKLGGPLTFNHYHFGGTRNGMVISWPTRIKARGEVRSQFSHTIDVVPTILEAAGITMPTVVDGVTQKPIEGTSLVYTFNDATAKELHTTQYFELSGNRGIYHEGWMASTTPLRVPWVTIGAEPKPDDFRWELYHVADDFSQADDLAAKNPEKLKELQGIFDREARRYNVYPIDSTFAEGGRRPHPTNRRRSFLGR